MSATIADITIPADTWVDLNFASNIAVGTRLEIHNKGSGAAFLAESAFMPADTRGVPLWPGPNGNTAELSDASDPLWAYSDEGTIVVVQDAT